MAHYMQFQHVTHLRFDGFFSRSFYVNFPKARESELLLILAFVCCALRRLCTRFTHLFDNNYYACEQRSLYPQPNWKRKNSSVRVLREPLLKDIYFSLFFFRYSLKPFCILSDLTQKNEYTLILILREKVRVQSEKKMKQIIATIHSFIVW